MDARLFLFDDEVARGWEPFAATRPCGELLYGTALLRERAERFWGVPCQGYLGPPTLEGFEEDGAPAVDPTGGDGAAGAGAVRIVLLGRCALELPGPGEDPPGPRHLEEAGATGARLMMEDRPVGWILPPEAPLPSAEELPAVEDVQGGEGAFPERSVEGEVLDTIWDLVSRNPHRIHRDLAAGDRGPEAPGWDRADGPEAAPAPGVFRMGEAEGALSVHPTARVEPGVVLDTRSGPIRLASDVRVAAGTVLSGPAWVGPGSALLGGSIGSVSIGPVCKVRGEVEASVVLGYANKAHDGYLGHSYLGRWVNLGAMTTNSDLKNNYGPVRIRFPDGAVDTGLLKVGCFLGDHVKTGIGTLLNTGTVVGAGSNLFGGAMPPSWVPPFRWGSGTDLATYDLDRFLDTARVVMERRGMALTPGMEAILRRLWERTAGDGAP